MRLCTPFLAAPIFAAACLATSSASALELSVTGALEFAPVAWSGSTVLLDQFNPGLNAPSNAELIGVKLRLDSTLQGDYIYNCVQVHDLSCTFMAAAGADRGFVIGETTVAGFGLPAALGLDLEGGVFGVIAAAGGEGGERPFSVSSFLEMPLDIAGFTGAGQLLYTLGGTGLLEDEVTGPALSFLSFANSNAVLSLTYSYRLTGPEAMVPVPAAAPLLASGLLAFGWLRHRRRRRG